MQSVTRTPAASEVTDHWRTLTAMAGNGIDWLTLILPDSLYYKGPGIYRTADWVGLWAQASRLEACDALMNARESGTSRVTLSNLVGAEVTRVWEIALTRMVGRDAVLAVARDVTERVSREEHLQRIAYHDGLTGLLNRLALKDRLAHEIDTAARTGGSVALLILDLDNFKLINDTLGHDAGDEVLVEAATRLRAATPDEAIVGRLGGDEFAVIVPSPLPRVDVALHAEALLEGMRLPVSFKGRVLDTKASIGVSVFPHHGLDSSELLKNADIALYAAKAFGRGGFTTYVPSMGNALRKRAATIVEVREAIAQNQLQAFYQPKIDFGTNAVIGFEALLRLRGRNGELIQAKAINHAFDDIDLARLIGDTMFDRVAADVRQWQVARVPFGRIALNVSAAEFRAGDFASRLLTKLRRAELSTELFEIEVSETVLAGRSTDYVASALSDLADAGVRVALDEFGTGSSSLAQLKRLPFHSIKIDRTFVGTLEDDDGDQAIVRAIVGLADGLGLDMTAVGIETSGQLAALRNLGCKVGQGNLLGPPIPAFDLSGAR